MAGDWMPYTRPGQFIIAKRRMDLFLNKETELRIPEEMVQWLVELNIDTETLQDRAESPERMKADATIARIAFQKLIAHMRNLHQPTFFMPPLEEKYPKIGYFDIFLEFVFLWQTRFNIRRVIANNYCLLLTVLELDQS